MNIPRLIVPVLLLTSAILAAKTPDLSKAPDELVKALYAQAKTKSPFQSADRKVLDAYFAKPLADLIVKDIRMSKNEVGAIDGDPLYDAQDLDIKNFGIGTATVMGEHALVPVTFTNMGANKSFIFSLIVTKEGWRISDIKYDRKRSLFHTLSEAYAER